MLLDADSGFKLPDRLVNKVLQTPKVAYKLLALNEYMLTSANVDSLSKETV